MDDSNDEIVIPVIEETLKVDTVTVPTGGVRIVKRAVEHEEIIEQQLRADHVEVKHVAINRVVDGPQPVRQTEDSLIVPIVEEVLKIERQWVLREEIHISKTQELVNRQEKVVLTREEAHVERLEPRN